MREYENGTLKQKQTQSILRTIENFHFVFSAITSQRSSGGISGMYTSHAIRLEKAKSIEERIEILQSLKVDLKKKLPSYQEFEANFSEVGYMDGFDKQKKLVQYILAKIDNSFEQGLPVDYEQMTIEHLAPQKFKDSPLTESYIRKLGNLILVSGDLNSQLGNKPFHKKKELIASSRVWQHECIMNASSWGETEIESRTKLLAELAYNKVWQL